MDQLSISQLAQFSGLKAHTIRMWEQRYNALSPNRSEGNTRYYDNSQLRRLLNIVSLSDREHKISELCAMPDKKLFRLVKELQNETSNEVDEYFISQIIAAGMSYDEPYFNKIFSHCLLRYGIRDSYLKVIYPILVRMGLMWAGNTLPPAQEHFISNLFRQKLSTAIDSLPPPKPGQDSWLLFLPENEFHEIGLQFSHYLISLAGKKVIYLGSNVPLESLAQAIKKVSVQNLLLFLVHNNSGKVIQEYINELYIRFKNKKIFIAGGPSFATQITNKKGIYLLQSVQSLELHLKLK